MRIPSKNGRHIVWKKDPGSSKYIAGFYIETETYGEVYNRGYWMAYRALDKFSEVSTAIDFPRIPRHVLGEVWRRGLNHGLRDKKAGKKPKTFFEE